MDDFWGFFEDDPDSGIIDEWGKGTSGDLSPGFGNRWIARNTGSDDVVDLVTDTAADAARQTGSVIGSTLGNAVGGLFGLPPVVIAAGGVAGFLYLKKKKLI
jgi:hypothetical protein